MTKPIKTVDFDRDPLDFISARDKAGLYRVRYDNNDFFLELRRNSAGCYAQRWRAIETPTGYASRYERRCELTKTLELGPDGYISLMIFGDLAKLADAQWLIRSRARFIDSNIEYCHAWAAVPLKEL